MFTADSLVTERQSSVTQRERNVCVELKDTLMQLRDCVNLWNVFYLTSLNLLKILFTPITQSTMLTFTPSVLLYFVRGVAYNQRDQMQQLQPCVQNVLF